MPKWCFKCRGIVDTRESRCSVCGSPIADVVHDAGLNRPRPTPAAGTPGFVPGSKLVQFLSQQYGVAEINLEEVDSSDDALALVPEEIALRLCLIPVHLGAGGSLTIAMADPSNIEALSEIRKLTGHEIHVTVAASRAITSAIASRYRCFR